jgi:hypothetical protein
VVSDGACMLILKREDDARRDGDTIYAVIEAASDAVIPGAVDWTSVAEAMQARCGYCHAADALLHVASAALALKYRLQPPVEGRGVLPWEAPAQGRRAVRLEASGLRDEIEELYLRESDEPSAPVWPRDLPAVPGYGKENHDVCRASSAGVGNLEENVGENRGRGGDEKRC